MKNRNVFFNGNIYTQGGNNYIADSMATSGNIIVAVGRNLEKDDDFRSFQKVDLKGLAVLPGFIDAHTHFYFMALWLNTVHLDGLKSLEEVLSKIKAHSKKLDRNEWVTGEGFSPDRWNKYIIPDKFMLDKITGGRPAAIYSKDQHVLWVNSIALEMTGIDCHTPDPKGGVIDRLEKCEPSGILRENPAILPVLTKIKGTDETNIIRLYRRALKIAYSKGVTGVHSFDDWHAFPYLDKFSREGRLGLRMNYYAPVKYLPELKNIGIRYGYGDDYLRVSGIKIFADGSLGSQTANCFRKYIGSKNNYGVEGKSKREMLSAIKEAAQLNLPCAIHAIGDRAVSNVLDCFEKAPVLEGNARHRIEHLQLIRRKDIPRLKRLGVTASMQPSHCPSDIFLIEKYWGSRGRNCFIFNTLKKNKVPLIFGSDTPIEPLDPIAGIDGAVNRKASGSRKAFYPEQRISVTDAIFNFTAAPALTVGQEYEQGYLLPGYRADFIVLSENIYKIPKSKIKDVKVSGTFFDGKSVYMDKDSQLSF